MRSVRSVVGVAIVAAVALAIAPSTSHAITYQVGPSRMYTDLRMVAGLVSPGDIVEVDGGATYSSVLFTRPGTSASRITIRGITVGGRRPVLMGGTNTIELQGNAYTLENFEITGGSFRCIYHHANDIVIRNVVVHDCPAHGLLGADNDSGSLTLEYSEFYRCGAGTGQHTIYMATDELRYPGSVFRMQYNYLHDGNGGNQVKSRAERNEIYYNWIEGALYHELELIGPDPAGGVPASAAREDSDVVGNVLRQTNTFSVTRCGGDATGESRGRYRFVNNTILVQPGGGAVFRLFDGIESIEMHNNVIVVNGAGGANITRTVEAVWVAGEQMVGTNNWVSMGSTNVPAGWTMTRMSVSPGLANTMTDPRPTMGAIVIDSGGAATMGPAGRPFPRPLALPQFHPPVRALISAGTAMARPTVGTIDIGAYEFVPTGGVDAGVVDAGPADSSVGDTGAVDVAMVDVPTGMDTGPRPDAPTAMDTGGSTDTGGTDTSSGTDSGALGDSAATGDGSSGPDGMSTGDGSTGGDVASEGGNTTHPSGCGCRVPAEGRSQTGLRTMGVALCLLAAAQRRRARRRCGRPGDTVRAA